MLFPLSASIPTMKSVPVALEETAFWVRLRKFGRPIFIEEKDNELSLATVFCSNATTGKKVQFLLAGSGSP